MKQQGLAVVLMVLIVGFFGGCDSNTVSETSKSEPTAAEEAAPSAEDSSEAKMEMAKSGEPMALSASEEAVGAGHNNEGVTHYQQSHWDVAQEHFQKALAENAKLAEAHYNLALALDKLGNHGEATNHFKTALELGADNPAIKDSEILQAHVGG